MPDDPKDGVPKTAKVEDKPNDPEPTPEPTDVTIPIEDFAEMQKQLLTLQSDAEQSKKKADMAERNHLFSDLERIKPQLAKIHEKSNKDTLKIVLATAREMDSDFPTLKNKDVKEDLSGNAGYRLLGTDEWIIKNK